MTICLKTLSNNIKYVYFIYYTNYKDKIVIADELTLLYVYVFITVRNIIGKSVFFIIRFCIGNIPLLVYTLNSIEVHFSNYFALNLRKPFLKIKSYPVQFFFIVYIQTVGYNLYIINL